MRTQSDILANSINFLLSKESNSFLKAREAVVKSTNPSTTQSAKEHAKATRLNLEWLMATTEQDINADEIIENYCGFNREWKPTDNQCADAANEHGISLQAAREMLEATLAQHQLYAQTARGNMVGIYQGWLCDIDPEGASTEQPDDSAPAMLTRTVIEAYKKAGEWMRRDEGLLIEASAEDWNVSLPKWSDVLPKASQSTETAKRRIQGNLEARAQHLQDVARQIMEEIDPSDW